MISAEKQYEYLGEKIILHTNASISALKLFVSWYAAIVGGSIWLRLQMKPSPDMSEGLSHLSNVLVILIAFVVAVMVFDNIRAWSGYRHEMAKLSKIGNPPEELIIRSPNVWRSAFSEFATLVGIVVATGLFYVFNPFLIQ